MTRSCLALVLGWVTGCGPEAMAPPEEADPGSELRRPALSCYTVTCESTRLEEIDVATGAMRQVATLDPIELDDIRDLAPFDGYLYTCVHPGAVVRFDAGTGKGRFTGHGCRTLALLRGKYLAVNSDDYGAFALYSSSADFDAHAPIGFLPAPSSGFPSAGRGEWLLTDSSLTNHVDRTDLSTGTTTTVPLQDYDGSMWGIALLTSGDFVVLDRRPPAIHVFDPSGQKRHEVPLPGRSCQSDDYSGLYCHDLP